MHAFEIIISIVTLINVPLVIYIWTRLERRVNSIEDWRQSMAEEGGGILLRKEHTELCRTITEEAARVFSNKLDSKFNAHKEWLEEKLKNIQLVIAQDMEKWLTEKVDAKIKSK